MQTKIHETEIDINESEVEIHIEKSPVDQQSDIPQISVKQGIYCKYIKRLFDIVFSLIALITLSPVLLIIAILVKIKLGSPVIFKQRRPGKNEQMFTLYKFRSMTDERDENGELLPDEVRLTKFGKWLRSTSCDELPNLVNIVQGNLSFVGPRPLLVEYLPLYNEVQKHRHDVKPGLTGLAQVKGRNLVGWEERFNYDIEYVHNITLVQDIKIIFQTVKIVVKRIGVSSSDNVTTEKFDMSVENKALEIVEIEEYTNV